MLAFLLNTFAQHPLFSAQLWVCACTKSDVTSNYIVPFVLSPLLCMRRVCQLAPCMRPPELSRAAAALASVLRYQAAVQRSNIGCTGSTSSNSCAGPQPGSLGANAPQQYKAGHSGTHGLSNVSRGAGGGAPGMDIAAAAARLAAALQGAWEVQSAGLGRSRGEPARMAAALRALRRLARCQPPVH